VSYGETINKIAELKEKLEVEYGEYLDELIDKDRKGQPYDKDMQQMILFDEAYSNNSNAGGGPGSVGNFCQAVLREVALDKLKKKVRGY